MVVGTVVSLCLLIALVAFSIRRVDKTSANRDVELLTPPNTTPTHGECAKAQVSRTTGDYARPHGNYAVASPQLSDVAPANHDSAPPLVSRLYGDVAAMHSSTSTSSSRRGGSGQHAPLAMGNDGHCHFEVGPRKLLLPATNLNSFVDNLHVFNHSFYFFFEIKHKTDCVFNSSIPTITRQQCQCPV